MKAIKKFNYSFSPSSKMPKFTTFILFLFCVSKGFGTHIVGGNFEVTHLGNTKYRIILKFLFDDINGDKGALDKIVKVSVFDKSTNYRISNLEIPLISEEISSTFKNECEDFVYVKTRFLHTK